MQVCKVKFEAFHNNYNNSDTVGIWKDVELLKLFSSSFTPPLPATWFYDSMLMVSHNIVLRRLDENLAVWQPSWRYFQWKIFPYSSEMPVCRQGTWNGKLPAAFSLNCWHLLQAERGCCFKDFYFLVSVLPSSEKQTPKMTYLFSQEGRITFRTLRIRAAPATPTTMTSIKLKKMGKDRNQNLHNTVLKSSTHWHITYNQIGKNKKTGCKT